MILLPIAFYGVLIFLEFKPLYKQKCWVDFWFNTALGILSFVTAILLCLNVNIPSPEKPIREFITMLFGK